MIWDNQVNTRMMGPNLIKEMEQEVIKVRQNLKKTQDRQKSHVYLKRCHKYFSMGDHVYFKVKPKKSALTLGKY